MRRRLRHERVVVNTKDDQALRGIVVADTAKWIVLTNPETVQPQGPQGLPGDLWVPQANVSTVQTVPA